MAKRFEAIQFRAKLAVFLSGYGPILKSAYEDKRFDCSIHN